MRSSLALALAALAGTAAASASATFVDGDTLHAWCLSADLGDQEACLGYVVGVADALGAEGRDGPRSACPRSTPSRRSAR